MQALIRGGYLSPRIMYSTGIIVALLVLWSIPPASNWFRAFVKLEPMRLPYTVMFFALLFCLLLALWHTARNRSFVAIATIGAISGQLMAILSIFFANLFIPDGVERTVNTIGQEGLIGVLFTDGVVALLLGGWLIGAIALVGLKLGACKSVQRASPFG